MSNSKNKTVPISKSVKVFLDSVENGQRKKVAEIVLAKMKKISKAKPAMWGASIVGFGKYHCRY